MGTTGTHVVENTQTQTQTHTTSIQWLEHWHHRLSDELIPIVGTAGTHKVEHTQPPTQTQNWYSMMGLPAAAEPAHIRIFRWHFDCVFPTTSFVSPACLFPWQFYDNCGCCERVGCLVHVTGLGSTKRTDLTNMVSSGATSSLRKWFPSLSPKTSTGV